MLGYPIDTIGKDAKSGKLVESLANISHEMKHGNTSQTTNTTYKVKNLVSDYQTQQIKVEGYASQSSSQSLKTTTSECFIIVSHNGWNRGTSNIFALPCYPEDISESTNASWSMQSPLGRSSPLSSYNNTDFRQFSISMKLHREMCNGDEEYIDNLLVELRRAVYPIYDKSGLMPPITTIQFGNFRARGYVNSVSFNWQKPIIDGYYQHCDVSMNFVDVPDSVFSAMDFGSIPTNPFNRKPIK